MWFVKFFSALKAAWQTEHSNNLSLSWFLAIWPSSLLSVQVNLCQKLSFLHQLTNNMTTDCSLNYKFNTWKFQAQTWEEHVSDIQNNFSTQHVLPMFCKKKSFWQRFTHSTILNSVLSKGFCFPSIYHIAN